VFENFKQAQIRASLAVLLLFVMQVGTAAAARPATRHEVAAMTKALRHGSRAAREPNCKLGSFRISDRDELYGAVTVRCNRDNPVYEVLMERDPWHVVEHCISHNIATAITDLHIHELDVCEDAEERERRTEEHKSEVEAAKGACIEATWGVEPAHLVIEWHGEEGEYVRNAKGQFLCEDEGGQTWVSG
jgi:hypothetical protein